MKVDFVWNIQNFKNLKEISYKTAVIFNLFKFVWGAGSEAKIPTQEEIEKTFKDLLNTCIKRKVSYAETGRLYARKINSKQFEIGFKLTTYLKAE